MFPKRIAILSLCAIGLACKTGVPDSEIAAKVNGQPITKAEFEAQVEHNMARYRGQNHQLPPSIETRIKESVLRRMIDDEMVAQKAKELGVDVTPADLEAKYNEYKGRFRTEQAFQDYLKRSKNSEENMKADLKRNMLRDRVVEKLSGTLEVTDEEVAKYYEENKKRFVEREQVKGSRILIRVAPGVSGADRQKAKTEAEAARKKAMATGADFAVVAKEYSKGPQAARGGDLGWFARGRMPPEIDNVVFNLEPNTISSVIETKMGYEVIKVWEKRPERERPLEEVKENIKNSLLARKRNEKRREILRELKGGAKIETLITFETPAAPGAPTVAGQPGHPPVGIPGKLGHKPPRTPAGLRGTPQQPPATPTTPPPAPGTPKTNEPPQPTQETP